MIQIPLSKPSINPTRPEALITTILVRGLSIEFFQAQVIVALHRLLDANNVITITYNRAQDYLLGRHDGMASIRCLNVVVYIHWCDHRAVPLLGKHVDFAPHAKSLLSSSPLPAIARQQTNNTNNRRSHNILQKQEPNIPKHTRPSKYHPKRRGTYQRTHQCYGLKHQQSHNSKGGCSSSSPTKLAFIPDATALAPVYGIQRVLQSHERNICSITSRPLWISNYPHQHQAEEISGLDNIEEFNKWFRISMLCSHKPHKLCSRIL